MEDRQEERIRNLEDELLINKTERNYRQRTEERNRRKRTELIAWLALLISLASIIINIVDKFA